MMRAIGALCLCTALLAQETSVLVRLAPVAGGAAPTGWRFARQHILPELRAWRPGLDPDSALQVTLDADGNLEIAPDPTPLTRDYLAFTVRVDGEVAIRGTCDRNGTERWSLDVGAAARDASLVRIGRRVAREATTGGMTIEVATLTGNLMAGAPHGDRLAESLMLGALECGLVDVIAVANEGDDTTWRVLGHGEGGLLLPALLVAVADAQSGRDDAVQLPNPVDDEIDRWLLLAATATGNDQLEAARQLARYDDPRASRALEALRRADGDLRLVALMGLERAHRRRDGDSTAAIGRAGPLDTGSATATPRQLLMALAIGMAAAVATCLAARRWLLPPGEAGSRAS